ncbi:MAG: MipA/OmpV family protein [Alteromonadaceae bacterium]|nr:MipA/OmpV family protein [Alteromonadaceae bacterium]
MNKYIRLIISVLLINLFSNVQAAETKVSQSQSPKSSTDQIKESLDEEDSYWELDLGIAVGFNRNYLKGVNDKEIGTFYRTVLLSGGYYYKDFFVEVHPLVGRPLTLGYSLQRTKHFVVNIIAESIFTGFDADSQNYGDTLTGINDRKTSLDAGIEVYYSYKHGEARFRALHDVSNTHKGYVIAFDYAYPIFMKRWVVWPSYGISWLSDHSTDYYFGINENEARPDRPFYQPGSSIIHNLRLYTAYQYNSYLSFFMHGSYSIVSNDINKSPLVSPNNDSLTLGMGVMWSF